jgi:hypothetical protein
VQKFISLVIALLAVGGMGFVSALEAQPVAGSNSDPVKKEARQRIVEMKDRIRNQRVRIHQDLEARRLTAGQARDCREVLDHVENRMKAGHEAKGPLEAMGKEQYDADNLSLDSNSAVIREEKQYFYYYGPYAGDGPNYDDDPVEGAAGPSVGTMEERHPRIVELKDRIRSQRERIDQGLTADRLTGTEAKECREILNSVAGQMKRDYRANGSMNLTSEQYDGYNTVLDVNSTVIHEERQYFYYYGRHYGQNRYWD